MFGQVTKNRTWTLGLGLGLAAGLMLGGAAHASVIDVYNQENPPTDDLPGGGWGTYYGFSVNFSDPALSSTGTVDGTLLLTELNLRHAGTQGVVNFPSGDGDWENALLKVYASQNADPNSWAGDSLNSADMSYDGDERNVTFNFDQLAVDTSQTYYFYFSSATGDPTDGTFEDAWTGGRLRISNDAAHAHDGHVFNDSFGEMHTDWSPVFSATLVPEPGSLALLGMGGLMLLRRRRN